MFAVWAVIAVSSYTRYRRCWNISREQPRWAPEAHAASLRRSVRRDSLGHRLMLQPAYANTGMYQRMKNLTRLADSRSNVKSFPARVQDDIGYAL